MAIVVAIVLVVLVVILFLQTWRASIIPIAADNLSAHRTSKVWEFLERNRNVRIHYAPTYCSWLKQVEVWSSKIQRDVIARGIFVSVKDLDRKLLRYIRSYNKKAKPFKWTYAETDRSIRTPRNQCNAALVYRLTYNGDVIIICETVH